MSVALLEFKNLSVVKPSASDRNVLDSINLTVYPGENIAILGPNGAGKSSLIKLIIRESYPLQKEENVFRVWGMDQWNIFDLRRKLGIVTQDFLLEHPATVTAEEMILSGFFNSVGLFRMKVTDSMRSKTRAIMRFLEIEHLKDRRILEMSSGEARRVLIGRALIHRPKTLILDEPTNSLDLHALGIFRNLLRKICASGTSIILVTHRLEDIIPDISRVVLIKHGRIIADGAKSDLLNSRRISRLFDTSVRIRRLGAYYSALIDA